MSLPPGTWTPVATDASTRRYYRGMWEGAQVLLADFGEDLDGLRRFVHVAGLFEGHGIPVPRVFDAPVDPPYLLVEWVEGRPLSKAHWAGGTAAGLLDLALTVGAIGEWGEGPELLALDAARLRFELAFFRVHFLEGFLNASVAPEAAQALAGLAEEVASYPQQLAHRDFHSDNVIVAKDGRLVLVDFQDALLAPRCYDAASLAVDPYRREDRQLDARFAEGWRERTGAPAAEFDRTALQRALKALGTFGYQVTRRKRARYVRFIPPQAQKALTLLRRSGFAELTGLEPHLGSALQVR